MGCSSSVAAKDVVCPDLSKAPVTPSTQPRNLDLVTQSQLADRIHSNEPRAVFRLPPLPGGEAAIEPQCSLPPPRPTRRRKALHPDRGDRGEVDGAAPIPVTDNVLSGLVDVDRQLMAHTRVSEYYKLETGPVQVGDPEEDDDISGWCAGLGALDSEPIEAPEIESNGDAVESENPPSNRPSLVLSSSRPSLGSQALLDQRDSKILQVVRRSFVKENTDEKRLSSYFIVHPRHDLEETVRSSKYFKEPGEDATNNEHLSSLEVEVSEILHQSPRNSFVKMIRTSFTAGNRDPDGPVLIDPGIATPRFSIYSDCSSNHAELAAKISAPPSTRNSMLYSEHAQQASDLEQGECNQPGNDLGREPNQEIVCSDDLTELELPERLSHLSIRASSYYGEEAHPVQGLSEAEVNEALQWGLLCVAGDSVISVSKPEEKPAKEFRISYMAQTGYYPDQDQRLSQDTWCIAKDVGGVSGCHFVAVLDGHGPWGTECAAFARNSLLEALAENKALTNNTDSILMGIKMAHQKANKMLQNNKSIDDSKSGTTCIGALFVDGKVYVSNVGDSRAVLAQANSKGRLRAVELSSDQNPWRSDELARVEGCGGVVFTSEQLCGEDDKAFRPWAKEAKGGSIHDKKEIIPRVWLPGKGTPGCAFTRSLGDTIASTVGVCGEPEILVHTIEEADTKLILGSDGVFEFLSSQEVVDIVSKYDDPSKGCAAVVQESFGRWLEIDGATDDITCVVIDFR